MVKLRTLSKQDLRSLDDDDDDDDDDSDNEDDGEDDDDDDDSYNDDERRSVLPLTWLDHFNLSKTRRKCFKIIST